MEHGGVTESFEVISTTKKNTPSAQTLKSRVEHIFITTKYQDKLSSEKQTNILFHYRKGADFKATHLSLVIAGNI